MKLVLFTPVIKSSAIGRMGALITRILITKGCEVTVIRTEDESLFDYPTYPLDTSMIVWNNSRQVINVIEQADIVIYQIGDNYNFHRGCLEWLPHSPGIVCLHDFFLAHLFWSWAVLHCADASSILRTWYGDEVANVFFKMQSEDLIAKMHNVAPLTEWICAMADGVIVHSQWNIERVIKACPGPVYVVPLAYDRPTIHSNHIDKIRHANQEPFTLLTIGHANSNKRIASVIQAIGNNPSLRQRTVYRLVGHIQPDVADALMVLAKQHQVNLIISGEVDEQTLHQAITQADVISCLRWPSLEGASASAIEAMLYGKALIVTDTGFYREIPEDCVKKINPENEIDELQTALEQLSDDVEQRQALGTRAQRWATATFTAENYVYQLLEMARAIHQVKPVLTAAQTHASVLKGWGASQSILTDTQTLQPLDIFNQHP